MISQLVEKVVASYNTNNVAVTPLSSNLTLTNLLDKVVPWVAIIAGTLAFFFLVYSGFLYLTANGNPDAAKKGQAGIINAIIGLVIIFLAWGITTAIVNLLGGKS
ncbi:MAG: pilin [Patescibacteria group bacterium]